MPDPKPEAIDLDAIEREAKQVEEAKLKLSWYVWWHTVEEWVSVDGDRREKGVVRDAEEELLFVQDYPAWQDRRAAREYVVAVRNSHLESHCLTLVAECRRLKAEVERWEYKEQMADRQTADRWEGD